MRLVTLLLIAGCESGTPIVNNYIDSCCDDCGDTGDTGGDGGSSDGGSSDGGSSDGGSSDGGSSDGGSSDGGTATTEPGPCDDFVAPEPGEVATVESCESEPEPIDFVPEVEWTWAPDASERAFNQVMVTPVVGNLTDDDGDGLITTADTPDIAFAAFSGTSYQDADGALVILDGASGAEHGYYETLTRGATTYTPQSRGGVALGDLDDDGVPEICFPTTTAPLICVHTDGTVVMVGDSPSSSVDRDEWASGYPVIGDMNGDGYAEVAIGRVIWDHDGTLLVEGDRSHGGYVHASLGWSSAVSVMSDMDDDGDLELIAGDVVYERDGSVLWEAKAAENGFSAVGDLDLDGLPDVVTSAVGTAYVIEGGTVTDSFSLVDCASGNSCGPPTIADFDADGEPEIGIAGVTAYTVYDGATGSWLPLWSQTINDYSGSTAAVVFDFEADGEAEVVFADEDRLFIWGGSDGSDRLGLAGWDPEDHGSGTGLESPTIADIDNDGSTEIVIASNELFTSGWWGVRAIGSGAGESWAPSRPVWNQHSYHITNVEDDLSIPVSEDANWDTFNNFRKQDQGDRPGSWLPDLTISELSDYCVDCDEGVATFYVIIDNQGWDSSGPVDLVFSTGGGVVHTESVAGVLPQESLVVGPITVATSDWVGTLTVSIDSGGDECDEDNNDWVVGSLPCEEG